MRQHGRPRPPARQGLRELVWSIRARYYRYPLKVRLLAGLVILAVTGVVAGLLGVGVLNAVSTAAVLLLLIGTAMRSPAALATGLIVVVWVMVCLVVIGRAYPNPIRDTFLLEILGVPVAFLAHRIRAFAPWKTAFFALVWAGAFAFGIAQVFPMIGVAPGWVVAFAVLGWRWLSARRMPPRGTADPRDGARERVPERGYADEPAGDQQAAWDEPPPMSVDDALAALENMIGLEPVKEQVRSIAASIEAARMRAEAGYSTEKPMRHFVFVGPSGTGKTTVARILGQIFYAYGLLETPYVVESQRADLVGEYLGATAIKTNEIIDRALGGVLFIDEAYGLVNSGDTQPDRFGNEAVQTLLKRAEDDRDQVVIILAGYEKEMESFLTSNPGLASRFATRVKFPGYTPAELLQIAEYTLDQRGDELDPDARPQMWRGFQEVTRRDILDELGNGRFVRSLVEQAAQARDVRVVGAGVEPSRAELVTVHAEDVEHAYRELTARHRGYDDAPSVEDALAELDAMAGLEPVKRQVRSIAAQLRVTKLREAQGLVTQPPMRHFVFTGPPGTGKTSVARILGRMFAALGLLTRPKVVEAQRVDLVGEYIGQTAVKTNKLIDSALGGVLFIDEAYSLVNQGYTGGDAYGMEAIQTLLKRAEDDRDKLVVILAGYPADMDRFIGSNPGLSSRFNVRVAFPSYGSGELGEIAERIARQAGDRFDDQAWTDLGWIFDSVCAEGRIDALGNGRFVRSLFEKSCSCRDLRVAHRGSQATTADLTTVTSADVRDAYEELRTAL